jgi:sulfur-oxidizing protein SoxX
MRKTVFAVISAGAALAVGALALPATTLAAGRVPDPKVCSNKANPPTDPVTQGGCLVLERKKGNCLSCHMMAGAAAYGDVAPPLVTMRQRFPDKARVRAQIQDPSKFNPNSVMPPFGRNGILTPKEIDEVVEFVMTL